MIRTRDYARFLRRYLALLALPALVVAANLLVVYRGGELTGYGEIVARQAKGPVLFGSAFNQNAFGYKLAMVRRVRPEVVALGSSRVMLFRGELFGPSFVNAGGAGNFLNEIQMFLDEMAAFHTPKVIILGLDFWWFNPTYPEPIIYHYHQAKATDLNFDKLVKPLVFLFDRRMTLADYWRILAHGGLENRFNGFTNYGLRASVWSNGFRPDGSHYYGENACGLNYDFFDKKFGDTLAKVDRGESYFVHGPKLDRDRMDELYRVLDSCRERGIKVIAFLPPLAGPVLEAIQARDASYPHLRELRALLPSLAGDGVETYDFTDMNSFGASACEFLDGFHGGDVAYARIVRTILERNPASALAPFVDLRTVRELIDRYEGRAVMDYPPELYKATEVDFLELGCPKPGVSKR